MTMTEELLKLVRSLQEAAAKGYARNPYMVYPTDIANRILTILVNHPEDRQ